MNHNNILIIIIPILPILPIKSILPILPIKSIIPYIYISDNNNILLYILLFILHLSPFHFIFFLSLVI